MTDEQTAELIELRKQDMGIVPLARRFGIGVDKVRSILIANGVSTQTIYQRIAWCIKAMFEVKNFPITLAEVRASCAAAGLAVDCHGNVTAPAKREA